MRVSIAIPVFNEEAGVDELVSRVGAVLDAIGGGPHEIVIVDDGSHDATWERLLTAAAREPRLMALGLSRNFGHQAALSAALDAVSGDVTIVMDGDLQDPPEVIPTFLEYHQQGYDVVYAQRIKRKEGLALRASYFLFYRVLERLSDIAIPLDAGDFALMSRRVVEALQSAPERHRFLRGLRTWVGFRQLGVPVERAARAAGTSKYTLSKLLGLAFDGLLAFSTVPIRAAAIVGMVTIVGALAFAAFALYAKMFLDRSPQGFTALTFLIVLLSGVQLLFLGVIGEYVGRVYTEVKRRPQYVMSKVVRATDTREVRKAPDGSARDEPVPDHAVGRHGR